MSDRFGKEAAAFEAFARLMKEARECRALFEVAHLPLPEPLSRFLGEGVAVANARDAQSRTLLPPPEPPPRPPEWSEGWVWAPLHAMTPTGLVLGVLRGSPNPMTAREVVRAIADMGVEGINAGSIANIGTRLSASGVISRAAGAWSLAKRDEAPVLHEGYAWGPPSVFDKQEIAAYRRIGICHVLKAYPDGLQIVQITKMLEPCEWLRAPCSKDLVKMDLKILSAQGIARRAGRWKKWRLVDEIPEGEK